MKFATPVLPMFATLVGVMMGCGADRPIDPGSTDSPEETTDLATAERIGAAISDPTSCSFSRGVTTCVTTTQREAQSTHTEVTGCVVGPSVPPIPGRRTRTFADVFLITETTTILQHGRNGAVFDTRTTTESQLLSSTLISDTCEPI